MKRIYTVTYEWKLRGKGEKYNAETVNVVAETATKASNAAIDKCREGFVEKLADVRMTQVIQGEFVDIVV